MRNVVFVAPFPMDATLRFARGLGRLADVRLLGVFQQIPSGEAAAPFADLVQVPDALDPEHIVAGVRTLAARHGPPHRVTGILEPLQTPLAVARKALGVAGPDPDTAERFRQKALMKDVLRSHGLPCARHRLIGTPGDALAFTREVGFPIVLKPPAGVGCRSTWRIDSAPALGRVLADLKPTPQSPILAEEFLRGREGSCELVVIGGAVAAHSISHYEPGPLEVMRTPWIQWVCHLPRDISTPMHQDIAALGARAVSALGLEDGVAHLEWYCRDDGSLAIGEIAARPPGGQLAEMTGRVHGADIYRTWGRAVVDGAFDGPWVREAAAATVFVRGAGAGRVAEVAGREALVAALGARLVEARWPMVGAMKSDSYEGEGFVMVQDWDEDSVRQAIRTVHATLKIRYAA